MILDANVIDSYMESVTNNQDGFDKLVPTDFSGYGSVAEAALQIQQESDIIWQKFNQNIARVEATYLRENGTPMVYTEANIGELVKAGASMVQRGFENIFGLLQKGMDAIKKWIAAKTDFVAHNKDILAKGQSWPDSKDFKGYDYKAAMDKADSISIGEDVFGGAGTEGFSKALAEVANKIGGKDGKVTTKQIKDYALGESITINGSWMASSDVLAEMKSARNTMQMYNEEKKSNKTYYGKIIKGLKGDIKSAENKDQEKAIHKKIADYRTLISFLTTICTAKIQLSHEYIRQIDRVAHAYVSNASNADKTNQKALNKDRKAGNYSESATDSVFGFESIFA